VNVFYLIGQIFLFLLLAMGAGLLLGWLLWGLASRPKQQLSIEGDTLGMQLARAKIEMERQNTLIASLRKRIAECEHEITIKNRRIHELEPYIIELAELEDQLEAMQPGVKAHTAFNGS
jgi:hypothetical protein